MSLTVASGGRRKHALTSQFEGPEEWEVFNVAQTAAPAIAAAAAVGKSEDPHVDELYHAMDADGDGTVTKVEFVEFVRAHKPKHGPFSKTAALQTIFGFDKMHEISRATFDKTFTANMAKGLKPVAFEFKFADGSGGESSPFDGLLTAEL